MKLVAVIGANYGDEGKGLLTDYFCARLPDSLVVRFNGGAQAGHTVVTPDGQRHVFSHYGAGSFVGAKTWLSQYFIANPIIWDRESKKISHLYPQLSIHPDAPVTTPWDMLHNRALELDRGENRHGSCGLGIWETELRHREGVQTRVRDLFDPHFAQYVEHVKCYFRDRMSMGMSVMPGWDNPKLKADFLAACELFKRNVTVQDMPPAENIVFEGAQGLLLDEKNEENYPFVSGSRTGLNNVIAICNEQMLPTKELEPVYVTRSYLTRHGPGPLPTEDLKMSYPDETNHFNTWQRDLRFGRLDRDRLMDRIKLDAGKFIPSVAFTHLDQCPLPGEPGCYDCGQMYLASGPTRQTIRVG